MATPPFPLFFTAAMRPTLADHQIAIKEALNSSVVLEQISLKELVPHMYLLNTRCDCIAVTPGYFRFRVTLDYAVIRNKEIPAHEDVTVMVDLKRKGNEHDVSIVANMQ